MGSTNAVRVRRSGDSFLTKSKRHIRQSSNNKTVSLSTLLKVVVLSFQPAVRYKVVVMVRGVKKDLVLGTTWHGVVVGENEPSSALVGHRESQLVKCEFLQAAE